MYPLDRRKVALHLYKMFSSLRKTASLLQVSHTTVSRWLKNPVPRPRKAFSKPSKSSIVIDSIRIAIQNDPFISINKLRFLVLDTFSIKVSRELLRIAIKRLGMTKKKAHFYGEPKNLKELTSHFLEKRCQFIKENRLIVSIDETSFGRNSLTTKGYSRKGQKLFIKKRQPVIQNISVLACASSKGWLATCKSSKAFETKAFHSFLDSLNLPSGSVILLDNVSFHHSKIVKDLCASKGFELLFVPPYSPWFNPIELCFSIVKRHYTNCQDIERSFNALTSCHFQAFFKKSLECLEPF